MRFTTTIYSGNGTTTGIEIPPEVVDQLGSKRAKVVITLNGFTYRSSVASMGGRFLVSLSAERREAAGVAAGDEVQVDIEPDADKRELELGPAVEAALAANPAAKAAFDTLSFSAQQRHVLPIQSAKTEATRDRNIQKMLAALAPDAG